VYKIKREPRMDLAELHKGVGVITDDLEFSILT